MSRSDHVTVIIPGTVQSAANLRECWQARHRRTQKLRGHACLLFRAHTGAAFCARLRQGGVVTLTRRAPRKLDEVDNISAALKPIRDGIAEAIGINDGSPAVAWRYGQERCLYGSQAVRVEAVVVGQGGGGGR
jgi:hypothetical protein